MDQKMYHCAEIHNREKAVWFWEKAQTFSSCLNPTISMLKSSPLKFPTLGPKSTIFSRSILNSRSVQDGVSACWRCALPLRLGARGWGPPVPLCAGAGRLLPDLPAPAFRRWKSACPLIILLLLSPGQALKSAELNCCQQWHFLPWPGLEKRNKYKPEPWVTENGWEPATQQFSGCWDVVIIGCH